MAASTAFLFGSSLDLWLCLSPVHGQRPQLVREGCCALDASVRFLEDGTDMGLHKRPQVSGYSCQLHNCNHFVRKCRSRPWFPLPGLQCVSMYHVHEDPSSLFCEQGEHNVEPLLLKLLANKRMFSSTASITMTTTDTSDDGGGSSSCSSGRRPPPYHLFSQIAFAWVRHVPTLPSSFEALDSPPMTFKGT